MTDPTATVSAPTEKADPTPILALDEAWRRGGAAATLDHLVQELTELGEYRALLDALLLEARHELGLPLLPVGTLTVLPEPARSRYKWRYVEAIWSVGKRFLDADDLPSAWPYFRAIGEPEPVARALDAYEPSEGDERLSHVIDVAFA